MDRQAKLINLKRLLHSMQSALLAYSGGVDSAFLLKVAHEELGANLLAVTAVSETYSESERLSAAALVAKLGARHIFIETKELLNPSFAQNPPDRCYYCKKELFSSLKSLAGEKNISFIIDGSNVDDLSDYRPGAKAKKEFGIVSPLQEVGLNKEDIRILSKELGLSTWDQPALACLASRIPYQSVITGDRLKRIEQAEKGLREQFLVKGNLRVRDFDQFAKIEIDPEEIERLKKSSELVSFLQQLGYREVSIDPKGYRCGSMNEELKLK